MTEQTEAAPDRWPNPSWREAIHELRVHIDRRFDRVEEKLHQLKEIELMAQSDIDALTTKVGDFQTALTTDVTNIQAELTALQQQVANGQPVDLSALTDKVNSLAGTVDSVGALVPPASA